MDAVNFSFAAFPHVISENGLLFLDREKAEVVDGKIYYSGWQNEKCQRRSRSESCQESRGNISTRALCCLLNCKGKVPKKGVVVEEDENVIDHVPPFFFFPWVIDIQNPESVLLVVKNKDCHEFRFKMVRIVISVSNVTSLKNCLCTVLSTSILKRSETQFAENQCELKHNLLVNCNFFWGFRPHHSMCIKYSIK